MTLEKLISKKDYDSIEFRMVCEAHKSGSIFYGKAKSIDGVLISYDGDNYDEELRKEIVSYKEWNNHEKNVKNGLTVVFDFK